MFLRYWSFLSHICYSIPNMFLFSKPLPFMYWMMEVWSYGTCHEESLYTLFKMHMLCQSFIFLSLQIVVEFYEINWIQDRWFWDFVETYFLYECKFDIEYSFYLKYKGNIWYSFVGMGVFMLYCACNKK